jgi:hypothetical protein
LAKASELAWTLATGEDRRWPTTEGAKPTFTQRLLHRYVGTLQKIQVNDSEVTRVFWSMAHLVTPPSTLFHPRMVMKVLGSQFKRAPGKASRVGEGKLAVN